MKSKDKLRRFATILGLLYILLLDPAIVISAPVTVEESNYGVDEGCYYMLDVYKNGEQIRTKEPCLNCTCTNSMLMCYLQTCPYSKPIGSECSIESVHGQCCPIIRCPEVPVMITEALPFVGMGKPSTPALAQSISSTTAIGLQDAVKGCYIDGAFYVEGSQVPLSENDPCDLCYCIHNSTKCVKQRCVLEIPGCVPQYSDGECCPTAYDCDDTTTFKPPSTTTTTTTTTVLPVTGCYVDDVYYYDGAVVNTGGSCDHCYCINGELVCAVQDCKIHMDNCTPVFGSDQCCPERFDCPTTEPSSLLLETTTLSLDQDEFTSSDINDDKLHKDEEVEHTTKTESPKGEETQSYATTDLMTEESVTESHIVTDEVGRNHSYDVTTEVQTASQNALFDLDATDEAINESHDSTSRSEISDVATSAEVGEITESDNVNDKEPDVTDWPITKIVEITEKPVNSVDPELHHPSVTVDQPKEFTTELEPLYSSSQSPLNDDAVNHVQMTTEQLEIANHSISTPGNASEIGYQDHVKPLATEKTTDLTAESNLIDLDKNELSITKGLATGTSDLVTIQTTSASEASEQRQESTDDYKTTQPSVLMDDHVAMQTKEPPSIDEKRVTLSEGSTQAATPFGVDITEEELETLIPADTEATINSHSTDLPQIPLKHDENQESTIVMESESSSLPPVEQEDDTSDKATHIGTTKEILPITESSITKDLEGIPGEGDCYQDGVTYTDGQSVPPKNVCSVHCTCNSSVIICRKITCQVPEITKNLTCLKSFDSHRCCPIYICNESSIVSETPIQSDSLVTKEMFATTVKPVVVYSTERVIEEVSVADGESLITEGPPTSSLPSFLDDSKSFSDVTKSLSTDNNISSENDVQDSTVEVPSVSHTHNYTSETPVKATEMSSSTAPEIKDSNLQSEATESVSIAVTTQHDSTPTSTEVISTSRTKVEAPTTAIFEYSSGTFESSTISKSTEDEEIQNDNVEGEATSTNVISHDAETPEDNSDQDSKPTVAQDKTDVVITESSIPKISDSHSEVPSASSPNIVQLKNETSIIESDMPEIDEEAHRTTEFTKPLEDISGTTEISAAPINLDTPEGSGDGSSGDANVVVVKAQTEVSLSSESNYTESYLTIQSTYKPEAVSEEKTSQDFHETAEDNSTDNTKIYQEIVTESPEKKSTIYEIYGNDYSNNTTHLSVTVKILNPNQSKSSTSSIVELDDSTSASNLQNNEVHQDEATVEPIKTSATEEPVKPNLESLSTGGPLDLDASSVSTESLKVNSKPLSTEESLPDDSKLSFTEDPVKADSKPLDTEKPFQVDGFPGSTEDPDKTSSTEQPLQVDAVPDSTEEPARTDSKPQFTEESSKDDTRPEYTEEPVKTDARPLATEESLQEDIQSPTTEESLKIDSKPLSTKEPVHIAPTQESTDHPITVDSDPIITEEPLVDGTKQKYTESPVQTESKPLFTAEATQDDDKEESTETTIKPESTEEIIKKESTQQPFKTEYTEEPLKIDSTSLSTEDMKADSKPLVTEKTVQEDRQSESTKESVVIDTNEKPLQVETQSNVTGESVEGDSKLPSIVDFSHVDKVSGSTTSAANVDFRPLSTDEPIQGDTEVQSTKDPAKKDATLLPTEEPLQDSITESTKEPVKVDSKPEYPEESVTVESKTESTDEPVKDHSQPESTEEPVKDHSQPESTEEPVKDHSQPESTEEPVKDHSQPKSTEEPVKDHSQPESTEEPVKDDSQPESTQEPVKVDSKPKSTVEPANVDSQLESTEEPVKVDSKPKSTVEPANVNSQPESTEQPTKEESKPESTEEPEKVESKPESTEVPLQTDSKTESTQEPVKVHSKPEFTEEHLQTDIRPLYTEGPAIAVSKPLSTEHSLQVDTRPQSTQHSVQVDTRPQSTEEPVQAHSEHTSFVDTRPTSTQPPLLTDSKPLSTEEPPQTEFRQTSTVQQLVDDFKPEYTEQPLHVDSKPLSSEEPLTVEPRPAVTEEPFQTSPRPSTPHSVVEMTSIHSFQAVHTEQSTDIATEKQEVQYHTSTILPPSESHDDSGKTQSVISVTTSAPEDRFATPGSQNITEQTHSAITLTTTSLVFIKTNATDAATPSSTSASAVPSMLDPFSTVVVPSSAESGEMTTIFTPVNISVAEKSYTTTRSATVSTISSTPVSPSLPQAPRTTPQPIEEEYTEDYYPEFGIPVSSENITLPAGACLYDSRIYGSAQQIPRDDPCEFCFCFRGEIICLQQSCPPPIKDCHEEPIQGYCCPRYECPITAVTLNLTDAKVTHPATAGRFRTVRALTKSQVVVCEFRDKFYNRGEVIGPASGPCMDCICGETGIMKCNPKKCQLSPFWQLFPGFKRLSKPVQTRDGRNTF